MRLRNTSVFYTAIDKSDTAYLSNTSTELHVKGNYEIRYGSRSIKDSGDVSGYMGFVYFNPDVPLDFNSSKFIFEKIKDSLVTL